MVGDYPDAADFTFDQPIIGPGWHPREFHDGRWLCWTGPENVAELRLRLSTAGPHELVCRVAHVLSPDVLEGLQVRVNGAAVDWRREGRDERLWLVAELPESNREEPPRLVTLQFATPRTVRPTDLNPGCGDDRPLGVAFDRIQFRPTVMSPMS